MGVDNATEVGCPLDTVDSMEPSAPRASDIVFLSEVDAAFAKVRTKKTGFFGQSLTMRGRLQRVGTTVTN